jgi:hypothetical protein
MAMRGVYGLLVRTLPFYLPDVIPGGPRRADLWESKPYDDGRYGVLEVYE